MSDLAHVWMLKYLLAGLFKGTRLLTSSGASIQYMCCRCTAAFSGCTDRGVEVSSPAPPSQDVAGVLVGNTSKLRNAGQGSSTM
eukprot:5191172-Amphidinium_carterae.1